ncbi:hypothetical protein JCM12141A_09420 [Mycolicibacterium hodleri]
MKPASATEANGTPMAPNGDRRSEPAIAAIHAAAPMPTNTHAARARPPFETAAIEAHTKANNPKAAKATPLTVRPAAGLIAWPVNPCTTDHAR